MCRESRSRTGGVNMKERYEYYMEEIESIEHAFRIIADLIKYQAHPKEQDAWLRAVEELGYLAESDVE
tara:strand:- start:782 stop:985 length:204 start_codon:yes stop_codon:yes gene_type:complete